MSLLPGTQAPQLIVKTIDNDVWQLSKQNPVNFVLIIFYRGLHCPICATYLQGFDRNIKEFDTRGISAISVSGDDKIRAEDAQATWNIQSLQIGYGQSLSSMRDWGLYVSTSIKESEPAVFAEPALFLIKPSGKIFYAALTSAPWGRPPISDILQGVDYVIANNTPARGIA
tara:strand:+ start:384 stop:896 length:513 start_codon:yes stop_codon:yes gene_type:complete